MKSDAKVPLLGKKTKKNVVNAEEMLLGRPA
jgi:hypothetical protein